MRIATPIVALALLVFLPAAAGAQDNQPYVSVVCEDLGDQPPKFESRAACRQTVAADKKMHARLKNVLRPDIHAEDGNLMARNYRHVVIAYAALWIFAVVFLVLLFLRQRALTAEITRLSAELDRALREEEEE